MLVVGRWLHLFDHGSWFGLSDLVLFPKLASLLCCFGAFADSLDAAIRSTTDDFEAVNRVNAVTWRSRWS